jgi:hypothetical protein
MSEKKIEITGVPAEICMIVSKSHLYTARGTEFGTFLLSASPEIVRHVERTQSLPVGNPVPPWFHQETATAWRWSGDVFVHNDKIVSANGQWARVSIQEFAPLFEAPKEAAA